MALSLARVGRCALSDANNVLDSRIGLPAKAGLLVRQQSDRRRADAGWRAHKVRRRLNQGRGFTLRTLLRIRCPSRRF